MPKKPIRSRKIPATKPKLLPPFRVLRRSSLQLRTKPGKVIIAGPLIISGPLVLSPAK